MEGLFRVLLPPPPLACVPTTAGSGSEASIAAVFTDPASNRKLAIADLKLLPQVVAIDPVLMQGLPPAVTAAGGMDALTHAVESYIGRSGTAFSRRKALAALRRITVWLPHAYHFGDDLEARLQMALAAHEAGQAFTRTNVGYAHAIAHGLGCRYGIPHGLASGAALVGAGLRRAVHRLDRGPQPAAGHPGHRGVAAQRRHPGTQPLRAPGSPSRLSGAAPSGSGELRSPAAAPAGQRSVMKCCCSASQLQHGGGSDETMQHVDDAL